MVDFRVPSAGRMGFTRLLGLLVGVVPDPLVMGDAGMVLNRFLTSALVLVGTDLVVAADILGARGVVEEANALALEVVCLRPSFVTLVVGLLSAADELPIVVRRDVLAVTFGSGSAALEVTDGAIEALLANPEAVGFLFSANGLVGPFLVSSAELVEALALCVEAVVAPPARRVVDDTGGRVGGLLSPLPRAVRVAVALAAVDGVGATGRFAVVNGRLGGTVVFRGGVTGGLLSTVCVGAAGLSSSERSSGTVSSAT